MRTAALRGTHPALRASYLGCVPQAIAEERTQRHVGDYRERIDELVASVAGAGYTTLVLTGESDLDFLVEYACLRHGLTYEREAEEGIHKGDGNSRAIFHLTGERADRSATPGDRHCRDHAWLWEVIGGHGGGSGGDLNA